MYEDHQETDERSNSLTKKLIYGDGESEIDHVMEMCTHIAKFARKHYYF